MSYCYEYPRPALTVDCVLFGVGDGPLRVLLIERGLEPFLGQWALPGGFVDMGETVGQAAHRELQEETGAEVGYLEELGTFSNVERDPRGRVVSVAFLALVRTEDTTVQAGDDAAKAQWFDADKLPPLAFDHAEIVAAAMRRVSSLQMCGDLLRGILPDKFTIRELREVWEALNGKRLDARNFRRVAERSGLLVKLTETRSGQPHRPPALYRIG